MNAERLRDIANRLEEGALNVRSVRLRARLDRVIGLLQAYAHFLEGTMDDCLREHYPSTATQYSWMAYDYADEAGYASNHAKKKSTKNLLRAAHYAATAVQVHAALTDKHQTEFNLERAEYFLSHLDTANLGDGLCAEVIFFPKGESHEE